MSVPIPRSLKIAFGLTCAPLVLGLIFGFMIGGHHGMGIMFWGLVFSGAFGILGWISLAIYRRCTKAPKFDALQRSLFFLILLPDAISLAIFAWFAQ